MDLQERWNRSLREAQEAAFHEDVLSGPPGYHERRMPDGSVLRAYRSGYLDPRDACRAKGYDYSDLPPVQPSQNAVREAATPGTARSLSASQRAQEIAALASDGVGLMFRAEGFNVREHAGEFYPPNIPVKSDADVDAHNAVAHSVFGHPLEPQVHAVRETAQPRQHTSSSGFINPLQNGPQRTSVQQSIEVALRGIAALFGRG
jgi:hypothetical protein